MKGLGDTGLDRQFTVALVSHFGRYLWSIFDDGRKD